MNNLSVASLAEKKKKNHPPGAFAERPLYVITKSASLPPPPPPPRKDDVIFFENIKIYNLYCFHIFLQKSSIIPSRFSIFSIFLRVPYFFKQSK